MSWEPPGLVLRGTARDLFTGTGRAAAVTDRGEVRAELDLGRRLLALETDPPRAEAARALLGNRVGSGFRALVRDVVPGDEGTALGLLLDDLPGAALISGYVHMRADAHAGRTPGSSAPPSALVRMEDICSGWRAGGTAMRSVAAGTGVPVQDCPPAPDLDRSEDSIAWHPIGPVPTGSMRRRRRIDVKAARPGDLSTLDVDAMFRDTFGEPDGTEVVLHEYAVVATLVGPALEIGRIEAQPKVLPFWECPLAADHVADLLGSRVGELRRVVPDRLRATRSCTHLNDLLRVLADVDALAAVLARVGRGATSSLGADD